MTDTVRRLLVRPTFLKWSLVAFVLLVPLVFFTAWDYLEARRLRTAIRAISAKGEWVTPQEARRVPRSQEAKLADRYYRAAALIAAVEPEDRRDGLLDAIRMLDWSPEILARMQKFVDERQEALRLLDEASRLPFQGFALGASYSYSFDSLVALARLAGFRTTLLVSTGEPARAAGSVLTELRLWHVVSRVIPPNLRVSLADAIDRLGIVVGSAQPDEGALAPISAALGELDRDDALKQAFILTRAWFIETATSGPNTYDWKMNGVPAMWLLAVLEPVRRPFVERMTAARVERLTDLVTAMNRPWPARLTAIDDAYSGGGSTSPYIAGFRVVDLAMASRLARELALVRCARVVVAIERWSATYRHQVPTRLEDLVPAYLEAVPIDPYSGGPVRLRVEARSYAVYSVGSNRRDDAGDFGFLRFTETGRESRDIGLRIQYR